MTTHIISERKFPVHYRNVEYLHLDELLQERTRLRHLIVDKNGTLEDCERLDKVESAFYKLSKRYYKLNKG